ncbi:akirin-2-like [Dendronephthya gigantea]|uniref:akirin-2-like n=1 Tax=Dendronephthya gigantea TaxID=151771 RepID=UPI00106A9775|nr:akirin-2-like [Dendronephthya gigantea]
MACATLKRSYDFDPVLSPQQQPCQKRRRYMTVKSSPTTATNEPSKFLDVTPKMTSEQIAQNVEQEWKRIQRLKKIAAISPTSNIFMDNHINHLLPNASSNISLSSSISSSPSLPNTSDTNKPIFTLKQVQLICERMLKEREKQLQEEYDKVLNQKLSEQYDAFVKFSHDQVQKGLGKAPLSYVS